MDIRMRQMKLGDVDLLARMIAALPLYREYGYTFDKAADSLRAALGDVRNDILVACDSDVPYAVAWVVKNGGFARSPYLRLIAVDEAKQRGGVGAALMREMESRHLKENGLFILVTSTNDPARSFYERLGYSPLGEINDFVKEGMTEVIYFRSKVRQ